MKEYITIKNFGPLTRIENLEIKQFTFLIGESSSGKSTLMKVVAMMRYLHKMVNIHSYLYHSKVLNSPFRVNISSFLEHREMTKMFSKESIIVYSVVMNDGRQYDIRIEDGVLKKVEIIEQEYLIFRKDAYISENRSIIPALMQMLEEDKEGILGFYLHKTNDDFGNASEGDKELLMDFVGVKMLITHPKGKLTCYQIIPMDNHHAPTELIEASSSIKTSASLALIVDYFAKDFSFEDASITAMKYLFEMENPNEFNAIRELVTVPKIVDINIEEPELDLFPTAQCALIEGIINTVLNAEKDRRVNMMLTTHSPYILNYLSIVLNQTKPGKARLTSDNLAVYRLYKGESQDLIAKDDKGRDIVDSYDLSGVMSTIYNEFIQLGI